MCSQIAAFEAQIQLAAELQMVRRALAAVAVLAWRRLAHVAIRGNDTPTRALRRQPMFVHERDAHSELLATLDKFDAATLPPIVVHCFTGTEATVVE